MGPGPSNFFSDFGKGIQGLLKAKAVSKLKIATVEWVSVYSWSTVEAVDSLFGKEIKKNINLLIVIHRIELSSQAYKR